MNSTLKFTLLVFAWSADAAPFRNLNFESAKPPANSELGSLSATVAVPSWHVFTGTTEEATVLFNNVSLGSARVKLGEAIPPDSRYGRFAVGLLSGISLHEEGVVSAGIWQRGDVPSGAKALLFDTSIDLSRTTGYRVSMEGTTLSLQPVMPGVAGADISAFSGRNVELRFESLFDPAFGAFQVDFSLDNIRFSPDALATVPEPSTWAMVGCGGLALWAMRGLRRS